TGFVVNEAFKIILGLENPAYNKYFLFNQRGTPEIVNNPGYKQVTFPFNTHFRKISREQGFDWDVGWSGKFVEELTLEPDPDCPLCSEKNENRSLSIKIPEDDKKEIKDNTVDYSQLTVDATTPRQTVALLLGQNADMITAAIGTLKSGKIYVPLDSTYPEERLAFMLEDCEARLIVTNTMYSKLAEKLREQVNKHITIVNMDRIGETVPDQNPGIKISPGAIAYILYTSGSTGRPKGVVQQHRYIMHLIYSFTNSLNIASNDRISLLPSFSFSASVMDMYGVLLNGASLHLKDIRTEGLTGLAHWVKEEEITIYHSVPTLFRYFASELSGNETFENLRLIYLAGEQLLKNDILLYKENFSDKCLLVNGLGCTEFNICRQFFMDKNVRNTSSVAPVGYEARGVEILILGEDGEPVEPGKVGEIALKSSYLALEYWNMPKSTAEKFLPVPGSKDKNERIYRTGDLGRIDDGCLMHLGRKDFQVKIRGQRVETEEIEAVLTKIEGIKEAVVKAVTIKDSDLMLAAYYVYQKDSEYNHSDSTFQEHLRKKLPDYMIPVFFIKMESLPLTTSGKVDRKALPVPDISTLEQGDGTEELESANTIEKRMIKIWQEVLDV
ncbi:MAG: amino acid adenylation domain-containing protein, partial [bacterium]|nr:amino acid adenylation domain-containing protein [bacterium]